MAGSTAATSPGLLSVREEALLEVLPFAYFIGDLYDLLIYIFHFPSCVMLHLLQKMSAVLTP